MEDGPQTQGANETAQPASKVVRLPRDWLGPHEELVPFGRRTMPAEADRDEAEALGSPPNAEDFWGERSAAIHGVVQAPSDTVATGLASATKSTSPRPRFGLGRRQVAAAAVLAAAAATAAVLALSGSAVHQIAGGARLNLAAIFSSGVSRNLRLAPRIISPAGTPPHARPVRHLAHRTARTRSTSPATQHNRSAPPAPTYAARVIPVNASPTYRSNVGTSSSVAHPSPSPVAAVSPTGESGALGPVQSPNG